MAEWFIASVLKTDVPKGTVSSNLTDSAINLSPALLLHTVYMCIGSIEHNAGGQINAEIADRVGGIHNREWGAALVDGSTPYLGSKLEVIIVKLGRTVNDNDFTDKGRNVEYTR